MSLSTKKSQIEEQCNNSRSYGFRLSPYIYKKHSKSQKLKTVDIGITIDALRHTYHNHIDHLYLISGDGDFVPLVQEVMRQGKKVSVGALSSGLHNEMKRVPDSFINLDSSFFLPPNEPN